MKVTYIAIIASALLVAGIAPIGIAYADKPTVGTGTIDPEWDPRGDNVQRGKSCVFTRHDTGTVEFKEDLPNTGIVGNGNIMPSTPSTDVLM